MPANRYAKFNLAFFACVGIFLIVGLAGLVALDKTGHLPPPPLTATSCIDEKFKFIRDHAGAKPDLLAVGSSATWRNLDFSVLDRVSDFRRPLNGAPCYVHIHETAWLAELYLDHFPSVRLVTSVLAMRDFEACPGDGQLFSATLGEGMMFEGLPKELVYFVNFRPMRLLQSATRIRSMRAGADQNTTMKMDDYGSGPITLSPPNPRDDVTVSTDCFAALRQMERALVQRNVRWLVVLMAPMPAWLERYDPQGKRDAAWRAQVQAALRSPNTMLIDGSDSPFRDDRHFVDPAHYHWRYVASFTRWIFEEYAALRGSATARSE